MKPKEYTIHTIEQLLDVATKENADRLIIDLHGWLTTYLDVVNIAKKHYPNQCEGKSNSEVFKSSFIWIDDGKHEIKPMQFTDTKTGETIEVKTVRNQKNKP